MNKTLTAYLDLLTKKFIIFFTYIKISKDLSAKSNQDNKERLQKNLAKKKKKKKVEMVVNDRKIYQKYLPGVEKS